MTPEPTGRILRTSAGSDLEIVRTFRAPVEDVWASITEPERSARWFGPWKGTGGAGERIQVQMSFEEGEPWLDMVIDACDPPHHLAISGVDDWGNWHLEVHLTTRGDGTELRFVQHLEEGVDVGGVGPGWEYYLDNLVAARAGATLPSFDSYYPAQKEYYLGLTPR